MCIVIKSQVVEDHYPEELKNLDIVLFNRLSPAMGEQYVLHRIVGRRKDGQFIVVGDNCSYYDLVDPKTGKTTGKNCTGIEKKIRFQQLFPDTVPERSFYDKPKDLYVSKLAKHRYLIINGIPVEQP